MEHLIRIVSWTVILGAAVALWFGGIRPLLPEGLLPEVEKNVHQVGHQEPLVSSAPASQASGVPGRSLFVQC